MSGVSYLKLLRGELFAAECLTEPRGGSDFFGTTTSAEDAGDHFVVNGQKVWTSGARDADYGMLIARTDWDQPKHRGITAFVVDTDTPGFAEENRDKPPETVAALDSAVWGPGFEPPVFSDQVVVVGQRLVGERHLKLSLRVQGQVRDGIWFGRTEPLPAKTRLAFRVSLDEYQGRQRVQLMVEGFAQD